MSEHTYKVVELVGSSPHGIEAAVENAINRASETLKELDWFEVKEVRGAIKDGKVGWYQVKIGVGFRILDAKDLHKD